MTYVNLFENQKWIIWYLLSFHLIWIATWLCFFGHSKAHNMHSSQILLCGSGTKWEIMTTVPLYHKYTVAVHMLMHSL